MISATPADKDIELNESTAYSISISYPISFSFAFSWWKKREQEWLQDGMTIDMKLFFKSNGIVGKENKAILRMKHMQELKVLKGDDFGFYYKEVFWNSIKGSQSDMREYE